MALDLSNKAVTMMIKAVVGSLGIDGEALIANITGFQHFVMECIGKHDSRLVGIENALLAQASAMDEILTLLKVDKQNGLESEFAGIECAEFLRIGGSPASAGIEPIGGSIEGNRDGANGH